MSVKSNNCRLQHLESLATSLIAFFSFQEHHLKCCFYKVYHLDFFCLLHFLIYNLSSECAAPYMTGVNGLVASSTQQSNSTVLLFCRSLLEFGSFLFWFSMLIVPFIYQLKCENDHGTAHKGLLLMSYSSFQTEILSSSFGNVFLDLKL